MSEKKKEQADGQEPEDNQSTETEAQSVEAADTSSNEGTTGGLQEDDENEPDDVLKTKRSTGEEVTATEEFVLEAIDGVERRLEGVADEGQSLAEEVTKMKDATKEQAKKIQVLETKLSDERIIAIARGLEKFLFRCEDTNSAMQATLDSQPIWWQKEIWRFLAITTMIAWLMVGVALSVPDLRIEIGRSLISEREQMMIEVAEEAWRQDEARREAEEAGRGDR